MIDLMSRRQATNVSLHVPTSVEVGATAGETSLIEITLGTVAFGVLGLAGGLIVGRMLGGGILLEGAGAAAGLLVGVQVSKGFGV